MAYKSKVAHTIMVERSNLPPHTTGPMEEFHVEDVDCYWFEDDGSIPNNPDLPMLVYPSVISQNDARADCRTRLARHDWGGTWVNGVYRFHHYHSTAHEFLGVLAGRATLVLGGAEGVELEVEAGDALVLPAGTGHCNLGASSGFSVMGAYPEGQDWDLLRGDAEDRPEALENIRQVSIPATDPLFGEEGPLVELWG